MSNTYEKFGPYTVVTQADLESLTSEANSGHDTRVGGDSIGKRAGLTVMVKRTADSKLALVYATGSAAADVWRTIDAATDYTPV